MNSDFFDLIRSYQEPVLIVRGVCEIGRFHPDSDGLLQGGCLHRLYAPISKKIIARMEKRVGKAFPDSVREIYMNSNGLTLFCESIYVRGSLECDGVQPISIDYGNLIDLPVDDNGLEIYSKEYLYIGSYGYDGSSIKVNVKTGEVYREARGRWGYILNSWSNVDFFLRSEFVRMDEWYKKTGGTICSSSDPI